MYDPKKYYCGPQWWPEWARRWLSQKFNFECYLHDVDYEEGNPRKKSDQMFLKRMRSKAQIFDAGKHDGKIALVYGRFVQLWGWLFKRPRWWNDL